jgi:uncharacterized membrane protein YphA (DoxX/SURF4 family)
MKNKILLVLSVLFGLMMLNAGLDKLFHYMPLPSNLSEDMMKAFEAFMAIAWLMPLVGVVEILGGLLFMIPKTRALGALVILPVIVGILLCNTITDTSGFPIAIVFFAINIWVLIEERKKYAALLQS